MKRAYEPQALPITYNSLSLRNIFVTRLNLLLWNARTSRKRLPMTAYHYVISLNTVYKNIAHDKTRTNRKELSIIYVKLSLRNINKTH